MGFSISNTDFFQRTAKLIGFLRKPDLMNTIIRKELVNGPIPVFAKITDFTKMKKIIPASSKAGITYLYFINLISF
jgi:dihydroorotate dehydrogenase